MTKKRLEQILDNVLAWGAEHEEEFRECLIDAMDLTDEEIKELELEEYVREEEDEEEDLDLPDSLILNEDIIDDFDYDDGEVDDDSLQECIDNYLSDEYGYCINDYNYKCHYNEKGKLIGIVIYNINWDTTE